MKEKNVVGIASEATYYALLDFSQLWPLAVVDRENGGVDVVGGCQRRCLVGSRGSVAYRRVQQGLTLFERCDGITICGVRMTVELSNRHETVNTYVLSQN